MEPFVWSMDFEVGLTTRDYQIKLITSPKWSTLEDRPRLRGNMIEAFELSNDFDISAPNTFFHISFTGLKD